MKNYTEILLNKIDEKNPGHAKKLRDNTADLDADYAITGNLFFEKYENYLLSESLTLDFGIDCYLKMLEDMQELRIKFIQSGSYINTSFEEVEKSVYANPEVMTYHMHGLVLAQFLWFDQYERIKFFRENLIRHFNHGRNYLEIGGGHGLYINEAMKLLPAQTQFDLVDISESSLLLAKGIINTANINYYLKNIFDFTNEDQYDFVTIGEVLEHIENPLALLKKISNHLTEDGVCYITTPVNAPMIDHIYLFNNEEEIRALFREAGFDIVEEKVVISEKITDAKARKAKVPVMYAAFIKKVK